MCNYSFFCFSSLLDLNPLKAEISTVRFTQVYGSLAINDWNQKCSNYASPYLCAESLKAKTRKCIPLRSKAHWNQLCLDPDCGLWHHLFADEAWTLHEQPTWRKCIKVGSIFSQSKLPFLYALRFSSSQMSSLVLTFFGVKKTDFFCEERR